MWRRGSISPLVDLLCDDCAAEGAALLPVEPQSDAFVTEYVLTEKCTWLPVLSLTDGADISSLITLTPRGCCACALDS